MRDSQIEPTIEIIMTTFLIFSLPPIYRLTLDNRIPVMVFEIQRIQ